MILIIDDNKDLASIFAEYLNILGYEALAVNNGREGIEKATEHKPDLILCDIGMAGMDGYDVARYIRNDEDLKDSLLIAISGYSSDVDVERALDAGFDKHLSKPLDLEDIRKTVEEFI